MNTDFETERKRLLYIGYEPHINKIDKEVTEEFPCVVCKGSREYQGFERDGSYRAYFICTTCGHWEEF